MRTTKNLLVLTLVAFVAVLLTAPSALAKVSLSSSELDQITAAGQPTVIIAGTSIDWDNQAGTFLGLEIEGTFDDDVIDFGSDVTFTFAADATAQQGLRALVLNNVFGENLVATGLNIASGNSFTLGNQTNEITQSWAAAVDVAAIPGTDGGDCNAQIAFDACGGDGAPAAVLSIYADQILIGGGEVDANDADVVLSVAFAAGFQENLAALVVNNVMGYNLAATAVNIQSGNVDLGANPLTVFGIPNGGTSGTQSNTINQFRGVPFSRPGN